MGETITNESVAVARPVEGGQTPVRTLTLPDGIGYMALDIFWPVNAIADELDAAISRLGATRGLIIDLRANTGGDTAAASLLASMLFDTEPVYRAEIYRAWSGGDLHATAAYAVRYHGPVVVLLGRRSSAVAWRFARNLAAMGRVVIAGELPAVAHGSADGTIQLPVPEYAALRRAQERLASS